MIEALVFDFDGVILDTETADYQTWRDLFQSYGADLELGVWAWYIGWGTSRFDVFRHLEDQVGFAVDRETLRRERRRRYVEIVRSKPVMPGALDYIETAQDMGLALGIASSSNREWVEGHLARLGIRPLFEVIRCSDDVAQVKPDPELYRTAVQILGAEPSQAVAIEDSAHGVAAAKSAGLHCLAVPNPVTRHMALDAADLQAASLAELPLAVLLERVGGGQGARQ